MLDGSQVFVLFLLYWNTAWWSLAMQQGWPSSSCAASSINWPPTASSRSCSRAPSKVICPEVPGTANLASPRNRNTTESDCLLCRWNFFTDFGHIPHGLQWIELYRCSQSALGGRFAEMMPHTPAKISLYTVMLGKKPTFSNSKNWFKFCTDSLFI